MLSKTSRSVSCYNNVFLKYQRTRTLFITIPQFDSTTTCCKPKGKHLIRTYPSFVQTTPNLPRAGLFFIFEVGKKNKKKIVLGGRASPKLVLVQSTYDCASNTFISWSPLFLVASSQCGIDRVENCRSVVTKIKCSLLRSSGYYLAGMYYCRLTDTDYY